jgi:hypothetical protein
LPGEELLLFYDPASRAQDNHGAALRVEVMSTEDGVELVIWASEQDMFHPDGRRAEQDFGRA